MKERDPIGEAVAAVAKRRKWAYKVPEQSPFTETKPRLYNPPRSSNDNRKRTVPHRGLTTEVGRRGIIEIRLYDDSKKDAYQGCVRLYGGGPSDYIVYVRRAYTRGAASRGRAGGSGSRNVNRSWYIASVQGADFSADTGSGSGGADAEAGAKRR